MADQIQPLTALADIEELEAMLATARSRVVAFATNRGAKLAHQIYKARRLRDQCFGANADVFGEPAWDLLLDLYSARVEGRQTSITSACIGASVPTTTALRRLIELEKRGLVERYQDPVDRRRCFVSIGDRGVAIMADLLEKSTILLSPTTDERSRR